MVKVFESTQLGARLIFSLGIPHSINCALSPSVMAIT